MDVTEVAIAVVRVSTAIADRVAGPISVLLAVVVKCFARSILPMES
jgi:hypothetical protein